jgi:DNA-binding transcriptional ArsR family regulator
MSTNLLPAEQARAVAQACAALSHPTRAVVLAALADGTASPVRLARSLDQSIAAVSHHFHVLRRAGLLRAAGTRPNRGTIEHFYALSPRGEALVPLLEPIARAAANSRSARSPSKVGYRSQTG